MEVQPNGQKTTWFRDENTRQEVPFCPWHSCFSGEELASHLILPCLDFLTYKTGMIVSVLPPTGHCEKVFVHITSEMFYCATQSYEMIMNMIRNIHHTWSKDERDQAFMNCVCKQSIQFLAHNRPSGNVH